MTFTLDPIVASRMRPDALTEFVAPWATKLGPGIIVMRSSASQWLIDLGRFRFQHLDDATDPRQRILYGTWTPFTDLAFSRGDAHTAEGTLVVEPQSGPPLRARIQRIPELVRL
jgi:hypothetical protein